MSTLNLDNFQFNEYTKQAMLAYFELEDKDMNEYVNR
jgi:hypothetical protein